MQIRVGTNNATGRIAGAGAKLLKTTPSVASAVVPGSGWVGETAEEQFGSIKDSTYEAQSIAHWNAAPYQPLRSTIKASVIAFHINGIDRVEFAADGGDWVSVTTPTWNSETSSYDYNVELDVSNFTDATQPEIRARVYPNGAGLSRVLSGWFVNVRSGASEFAEVAYVDSVSGSDTTGDGTSGTPYRSINKAIASLVTLNGAAVYCKAGDYVMSEAAQYKMNEDEWLTITTAPGVASGSVVVIPPVDDGDADAWRENYRLRVQKIKWKNITFDATEGGTMTAIAPNGATGDQLLTYAWIDSCDMTGAWNADTDPEATGQPGQKAANGALFSGGLYVTNTVMSRFEDGPLSARLARGCSVSKCQGDLYSYIRCVVNCTADDNGTQSGAHRDMYQIGNDEPVDTTYDNYIFHNVKITNTYGQGVFLGGDNARFHNVAIVNVYCVCPINPPKGLWKNPANHLLFWHLSSDQEYTFPNDAFDFDGDGNIDGFPEVKSLSVRGCAFQIASSSSSTFPSGWDDFFVSNHYEIDATSVQYSWGTDVTSGDLGNDFYDASLEGRVARVVGWDVNNNARSDPSTVGAFESQP
jgi:hypothetical protein